MLQINNAYQLGLPKGTDRADNKQTQFCPGKLTIGSQKQPLSHIHAHTAQTRCASCGPEYMVSMTSLNSLNPAASSSGLPGASC